MRTLREFLVAIGRDWIALVSGVVGIIATVFGLWGPASVSARWLFVAFGFVGVMLAAFNVWREERRRGMREIRRYKTAFMRAYRRLREIDERVPDIERQIAPLNEMQRAALAKLGRLGEMAGTNFDLQSARHQVDFIVSDGGLFRPTDAYRRPLAKWAQSYKVPMVVLPPPD